MLLYHYHIYEKSDNDTPVEVFLLKVNNGVQIRRKKATD